jgi:hypothetical protein
MGRCVVFKFVATAGMVLGSLVGARAQEATEVLLEGKLIACDLQSRMINVMGIGVYVPAEAVIMSPTRKLQLSELVGTPLPGRMEKGFLNGTAIVTAHRQDGKTIATEIQILPEENVLIGRIDYVQGRFSILGKPVVLIQDSRMAGKGTNAGGLPIHLNTAVEGSLGAADGYIGQDGTFYAFHIEADEAQIPAGTVATAIVRARARSTDLLELSGGTTAMSGVVRIRDADTGVLIADVNITSGQSYGIFSARLPVKTMPTRVQATCLANGSRSVVKVQP